MGKGFYATHGVEGEDLSELIMRACKQKVSPQVGFWSSKILNLDRASTYGCKP